MGVANGMRQFAKDSLAFVKALPDASTPDSRWGALQIVLAISFFFLGIVLATLSIGGGGVWKMIVCTVGLFMGVALLFWALWLGVRYFRESKKDIVPLLTITESAMKISTTYKIEDGRIKVRIGRYEIEIRDTEQGGA